MPTGPRVVVDVPLNRVEGDLEIRVAVEQGRVSEAWSAGIMYRGFENLLRGRAARDGLVLTPRICGICGTAHLTAAVLALENAAGVTPPAAAVLVRNLALMTEHLQSDIRQALLMFMVDLVNPAYADRTFHADAVRRYEPFKGTSAVEALDQTKRVIEVIAILGGQWPHSSYMVPGGIATVPSQSDILQVRYLVLTFLRWYEQRILGCSLERWHDVRSVEDLEAWLEESADHRNGDVGFFLRSCRELGLDRYGQAHDRFLAFDQLPIPPGSRVRGRTGSDAFLLPAALVEGGVACGVDQARITEHVAASHYAGDAGGCHPFDGTTRPAHDPESPAKYSWAKAPRYDEQPAEVGPLAEMLAGRHPLFEDLVRRTGATVMVRQLARFVRPAELLPAMRQWTIELDAGGPFYEPLTDAPSGRGVGMTEASRGAIGHWIEIAEGRLAQYQIITPTAWNGSPRDSRGIPGPWEKALQGVHVTDEENPVELGHVIRSFDPCLVCTVHGLHERHRLFTTSW